MSPSIFIRSSDISDSRRFLFNLYLKNDEKDKVVFVFLGFRDSMFEIIVSFWSVCVFFLEFSFEIAMEMMDLEIPMGSCAPWFLLSWWFWLP